MTTIHHPARAGGAAGAAGATATIATSGAHPLGRLYALNPKLEAQVRADPGLRAFLEHNRDVIVGFDATHPPAGSARTNVTFDTWTHATSIVPPRIRDEEFIVVIARGSAYQGKKDIEIPLQGGGTGTSDGVIAYVGRSGDYQHTFVDDKDSHYPGAGSIQFPLAVFGKPGEQVELSYCRIKPDAQGRAHPSHAAWPDSFDGVFGGYAGRDRTVTIQPGGSVRLKNPD
jgi:hypothetical protein